MILLAADGLGNDQIAEKLDVPRKTVSGWRKRFYEDRLAGLEDQPRSGRPPDFSPQVVAEVKALACELPATSGVPLSRYSTSEIAREVIDRGCIEDVSFSSVWRWLNEDALRPWRQRMWIFPRDPHFQEKATPVLDLYHGIWQDQPLGSDEYVLSADEKTSIQARCRIHETVPITSNHPMLVEHEYERKGALAYLAAWDVHRAKLFGRCEPKTGIAPFNRLLAQVMNQEPYCNAKRVFLIIDNGSSHRGQACIRRLQEAWPTLVPVHLPVHASWLNQIEIYFSIVQRKVLTPNDFVSLEAVEHRLLAFQKRYEEIAKPFAWKFTRLDLIKFMERLSGYQHWNIAA
jgi:transposase